MQHWGFTLAGILLIICGLIYAAIPQTTPYQGISKTFLAHYLSGRGIGYLQLQKSSVLYIVNEGDFLPAFSADYLNHGNILISFLYQTDEMSSIDVSSENHVHLVGQAFPIVKITLYHQYGQQPVVFSSHEYSQNPHGYYQHNWPGGIGLLILGIIFIGSGYYITIFRSRKKKQLNYSSTKTKEFEDVNRQTEKVIQSK